MKTLPSNLVVACALATAACSSPRTGSEVDFMLSETMKAATTRHAAGDEFEAIALAYTVARVDDSFPGTHDILDSMPTWATDVLDSPVLGSNVARRAPDDVGLVGKILWYLPDRILDLFDLVSFDVNVGPGLWVDVHVTRGFQLAAGGRTVGGIGWHDHRSLGVKSQAEAGVSAIAFGAFGYSAAQAGTSGVRSGSWSVGGIHGPGDDIYQRYVDYWSVGASTTVLLVGVDFDLHLAEMVDFLVGWATFDPCNDDFAKTRGLKLSATEKRLSRDLSEVLADEESLEAYRTWKASKSTAAPAAPAASTAPAAPTAAPTSAPPAASDAAGKPGAMSR